jgi:translation elongation factor EF-Tu-like GTPase
MSGAISNEESWQAKVKEMEAKVAAAEIKSQEENVRVVEKVVKKTEYITRRGQDIIQYIDREIVKYDDKFKSGGQCELPKEFIKAINKAAEAPK